jgi:hypothetical protein
MIEETIDYSTLALVVAWTAGIVAGIRARLPKLDGWWVIAVTVIAATIASVIFLVEEIPPWVRYALLGFSGAIGGVSLTDRLVDRAKKKGVGE